MPHLLRKILTTQISEIVQKPELQARKTRRDGEKQTELYSKYENLGLALRVLFLFCGVPYDESEAIFLFEMG